MATTEHATVAHLIRTLARLVDPETLTPGQRAGLMNAVDRARNQIPELYHSCNLTALYERLHTLSQSQAFDAPFVTKTR